MKKVVNKTRGSFLIAFIFVISGALTLVGLVYLIEGNAIKLQERVGAIAYQKAQEEERYETERLLEETKEERDALSSFVLTEGSVIDFITNIESIAGSLGLDFNTKSITPEETKKKNFDELSTQLSFSGSKPAVEKLVVVFETIPYHSYIRDLNVRQSEGGRLWTVDMTLVVTIFEHD